MRSKSWAQKYSSGRAPLKFHYSINHIPGIKELSRKERGIVWRRCLFSTQGKRIFISFIGIFFVTGLSLGSLEYWTKANHIGSPWLVYVILYGLPALLALLLCPWMLNRMEPLIREQLLHHCVACGYNLTGTREANHTACSECGRELTALPQKSPDAPNPLQSQHVSSPES